MKSRFLTPSEIAKLRAACDPLEWLPFELSLCTGLRIGDILQLRSQNIGCGVVRYTAQKTGKRGEAECPDELCKLLRGSRPLGAFVFPGKNPARPLTRQQAWKRLKLAARRAGIDPAGVSPHALRKSFAVQKYHRDGLEAVQAALQHSKVSTTEIYTLSDWISGENASKPLTRGDLPYIIERVADALKCRIDNRADL